MTKVPMHTNIQTGYEWVQYTLNGNKQKCHNSFRMSSHVFWQLFNTLRTRYGYGSTKRNCLEESVAMTLVLLGNAMGNRMIQDRFLWRDSASTCSHGSYLVSHGYGTRHYQACWSYISYCAITYSGVISILATFQGTLWIWYLHLIVFLLSLWSYHIFHFYMAFLCQ